MVDNEVDVTDVCNELPAISNVLSNVLAGAQNEWEVPLVLHIGRFSVT
jgi:hypothetical protein